jgi:peptidoglycan/LPS O-acetylase OafA/YrhL
MAALHGAANAPPTAASPLLHSRAKRLDTLEGLRTVLIMYIVIYHVRWALPPMVAPWFQTGHWAVQFFFVLAGFVAATSAGQQQISITSARTMTVRRITRLCPPYFIALLGVAAVVGYRGGGQPFLAWPLQTLLLQSLLPVKVCGPIDVGHWSQNFLPFSANGEGWFVSAIFITSLCYPLLHNARPRGLSATSLALVLVIVGRSVPTFLMMKGFSVMDLYTFAPVRLLEFAAGVLSAQLYKEMYTCACESSAWHWIFDASLIVALAPICMLGHWPMWAACENSHGDYFLTGVFCLTCIAAKGLADAENYQEAADVEGEKIARTIEGSPLSAILGSWMLVAPAVYSYQAYVYQEVFIAVLGQLPQMYILKYWWLPILLTWAAAVLSVHLMEEPLKQVVERRLATARSPSLMK